MIDRTSMLRSAGPAASAAAHLAPSSRPLIVEIVGPAGAGKTTLLRALGADPRVQGRVRIERGRLFPEIMVHAAALFPLALALLGRSPNAAWYGMLHFVRLRALPRAIARASAKSGSEIILLDEGPVFSLGRLSVFQQANRGTGRTARAWRAEVDRWASRLDAVVWIDAPDTVLAERIRTRAKDHQVKGGADEEIADFLGRYRQAYREILDRLTASGSVAMVQLDTANVAVDAAADRVRATLERLARQHNA